MRRSLATGVHRETARDHLNAAGIPVLTTMLAPNRSVFGAHEHIRAGTLLTVSIDLRMRLQQRLAFEDGYLAIGGLTRIGGGEPKLLNRLRSSLRLLAYGGPFVHWFDNSADAGLELDEVPIEPQDLVRAICDVIRERSIHLERVEDDYERFFSRITINIQERTGISIPRLGESKAIWCRHYATSVSRAYCELAGTVERFANTAVLFIMGVPSCKRHLSLHAWNWLVDFNYGRVWAFDPQNEDLGRDYANVSALLYTCAAMRAEGQPVPGLRALVRRHESVHGGTTLFHLARHPIDRASRHAIMARLASSRFERVIPTWQEELDECNSIWGDSGVNVADLVRFADG